MRRFAAKSSQQRTSHSRDNQYSSITVKYVDDRHKLSEVGKPFTKGASRELGRLQGLEKLDEGQHCFDA